MTRNPQHVIKTIRQRIAENSSIMTLELARELGVKEADVIRSLPDGMAVEAPAEDFEIIWERMTAWEKVTFICISCGCVTEVSGPLPTGKRGHGMFNLRQRGNALGGHILVQDLGSIWLVSKPVFGKESHSVQFFSKAGDAMFSVYLGRDDRRNIIEAARQDFLAMKQHYEEQEG